MASNSTPLSSNKDVDKSSAAYLKRREQVRRAQRYGLTSSTVMFHSCTKIVRTHRERKETYIYALESEVLALRTKARSVQGQNDELSRQIEVLKKRAVVQGAGSEVCGAGWGTRENVDGEDTGSLSCGSCQAQCLSTSLAMPWQECGVLTGRSGTKNWSISESHAHMAMEFVLTYVHMRRFLVSVTDMLVASRSHALCGRNQLYLTHSMRILRILHQVIAG